MLQPEKENNNCEECGRELHGRIDQRFCNDTCRNSFNRKKRISELQGEPPFIPQIISLLRLNRKILWRLLAHEETRLVSREQLIIQKFSFKFYTSVYQTKKGEIYHYVFDYGWLATETGKILLVRRIEQADL
ncbi:hypothetical protein ACFQZX_00260 [Mucilaginibacter litoreus]|uniref:DUF2116 family Zn-ribbon domain-containing protein n=1 Tax=Mucilaginibacter litoreus TaxID=1048221 RepID=A0ABW3ALX6_9SPHI